MPVRLGEKAKEIWSWKKEKYEHSANQWDKEWAMTYQSSKESWLLFIFNLAEIHLFDKYLQNEFCMSGTEWDERNYSEGKGHFSKKKKKINNDTNNVATESKANSQTIF